MHVIARPVSRAPLQLRITDRELPPVRVDSLSLADQARPRFDQSALLLILSYFPAHQLITN